MTDGSFTLRKNKSRETESSIIRDHYNPYKLDIQIKKQELSYKYFNRGVYAKEEESNTKKVEFVKARKMKKYDDFLKKFKYSEALKHSLTTKDTQIIVSVIEELLYRNGLDIAVKNLGIDEIRILLNFVYKKCDSSNHQQLIFYVLEIVLKRIERWEDGDLDQILGKVREKISREEEVANEAIEISGIVDLMVSMG